jgi:hypothetical protein
MLIPTLEMIQKDIQGLYNFSFLEIVKMEPANKVKVFFKMRCLQCP